LKQSDVLAKIQKPKSLLFFVLSVEFRENRPLDQTTTVSLFNFQEAIQLGEMKKPGGLVEIEPCSCQKKTGTHCHIHDNVGADKI
jgi:hypothetical protein